MVSDQVRSCAAPGQAALRPVSSFAIYSATRSLVFGRALECAAYFGSIIVPTFDANFLSSLRIAPQRTTSHRNAPHRNATHTAPLGFLNVFAFLSPDGMVTLRDMDGEEIVAFDAGHHPGSGGTASSSRAPVSSSPAAGVDSPGESAATAAASETENQKPAVVIRLTADTSEAGPVVVTAGADGTARVHALTVYYRGKRVAGAGARGTRSRRESKSTGTRKETPVSGSSGEGDSGGSRPRKPQEEAPARMATQAGEAAVEEDNNSGSSGGGRSRDENSRRRESSRTNERGGSGGGDKSRLPPTPPATAMGVGIAVEFKTCLGSACDRSGERLQPQGPGTGTIDVGVDAETADAGAGTGSALLPGETATVTSMDAFYHRS